MEVEDEIHVLIRCPAYSIERQPILNYIIILDPLFKSYNSIGKFLSIMHSENPRVLKLLGKFLLHVFKAH